MIIYSSQLTLVVKQVCMCTCVIFYFYGIYMYKGRFYCISDYKEIKKILIEIYCAKPLHTNPSFQWTFNSKADLLVHKVCQDTNSLGQKNLIEEMVLLCKMPLGDARQFFNSGIDWCRDDDLFSWLLNLPSCAHLLPCMLNYILEDLFLSIKIFTGNLTASLECYLFKMALICILYSHMATSLTIF